MASAETTSHELPRRFGWVGLGQMGYPMVTNLRRKLPKDRSLVIYDLDRSTCERFMKDWMDDTELGQGGVGELSIVGNAKEVAENSVCLHGPFLGTSDVEQDCFISIVPEGT